MIEWEEYKEECCVVIPVYREYPLFFEQTSIMQCVKVLGQKYDICLVAPFGLNLAHYESLCPGYKFRVKGMAKGYFTGIPYYNHLCKHWEFYNAFNDYLYILIYQTDCWIFSDNLKYFMSLGYDYIGAPWFKTEDGKVMFDGCGNGGFSLRRVQKFIEVCKNIGNEIENNEEAEDIFFCKKCSDKIKISPVEVGREFSFEVGPSVLFKLNGNKLPMGCHKPYLFEFKNFWKDYIRFC